MTVSGYQATSETDKGRGIDEGRGREEGTGSQIEDGEMCSHFLTEPVRISNH